MSSPKWLNKKETTRGFSDKSEKKIGKMLRARQTSNSGATWHSKGDLKRTGKDSASGVDLSKINDAELIEIKATHAVSMTVKKEWLTTIREQAIKSEKSPVLALDFGDIMLIGLVVKRKKGEKTYE